MIYKHIEDLLAYGLANKLIEERDTIWARNALFEILKLSGETAKERRAGPVPSGPSEILAGLSSYAAKNGLLPADVAAYREIFETAVMAIFTRRPSDISDKFFTLYKKSPQKATEWFYNYCQKIYYVKADRAAKNIRWRTDTRFGRVELAINLAKPEKDPKEILLAAKINLGENNYPKCLLCRENEGYAGRLDHPARQNLRIIPLTLGGGQWDMQYSPYVYYDEHSIVFTQEHKPMKITGDTFKTLLDFVEIFPHYFIGSNADLPIVGGSILNHEHYQAGRYKFPLESAKSVKSFKVKKCPGAGFDIIRWPMAVIRVRAAQKTAAAKACAHIFETWRKYDDKKADILHASKGIQHSAVTPIARFKNGKYEVDIVLRNNRTEPAHPHGIFAARPSRHNIKRENIGLIECLGLGILPGRLKSEFTQIAELMQKGCVEKMRDFSSLAPHYDWVKSFIGEYKNFKPSDGMDILLGEAGLTFAEALYDCGVFKHDAAGKEAFLRFIKKL